MDTNIEKGDKLFDYMIHNFESMFDGEKIKHFAIVDGIKGSGNEVIDVDEFTKAHNTDIQKVLILWIKKEYEEGRLFIRENWKSIRDSYNPSFMYLGYKKMFQFRNSYTQIRVVFGCDVYTDDCEYCMKNDISKSFCLGVYGWKDEFCTTLQPYRYIPIPDSETMLIPDQLWKIYK